MVGEAQGEVAEYMILDFGQVDFPLQHCLEPRDGLLKFNYSHYQDEYSVYLQFATPYSAIRKRKTTQCLREQDWLTHNINAPRLLMKYRPPPATLFKATVFPLICVPVKYHVTE